nr:hypothetical protein [uncultured Roseateles sp.]
MHPTRRDCLALALLASGGPVRAALSPPASGLELLTQYDYPPFVTTPGAGLSHDWAAWLAQRLPHELAGLRPQILPRRRLDQVLAKPQWTGIVPWVAPSWFGDAGLTRFIWSEPVMDDEDLVLSLKSKPVLFDGPASLKGLRLGGVAGHVYVDIDPLVKRGELLRDDATDTGKNLRKLLLGRVDVIFLSRSGMPWWQSLMPEMEAQLFVAPQPRARFQRRMLLSPQIDAGLRAALLTEIEAMPHDPAWQEAMRHYGLGALASRQRHGERDDERGGGPATG